MILLGERLAGAEQHVFMILPELVKFGYNVSLLNLSRKNKKNISDEFKRKLNECEEKGVNILHYSLRNRFDFFSINGIAKLIYDIKPDIVHTHMIYGDLFGSIAAKKAGVRTVVSTRHYDYSFSTTEIIKAKAYYTIVNRFQDRIICVSNKIAELSEEHENFPKAKITTIPLGYSDAKVNKAEARIKINSELGIKDELLIGSVSRLIKIKGINYALQAAKKLKEMKIAFKWLVAGEGREKENLILLRNELGLENEVIFLGQRNDIHKIIAALDVMVHPTLADSFGLVVLEAFIQSTPVIATTAGALPELISNNQNGILVDPKDPGQIKQEIVRLAFNSIERKLIGENGRLRFESFYTLEKMVLRLSNYYDHLS